MTNPYRLPAGNPGNRQAGPPSDADPRTGEKDQAELSDPYDLPYSEDWECFARLARAGPVVYLDCETAWRYDHGGPRMTDIALEDRDATQLRVLERVWGRDGEFLARHRKWYESVVRRLHLRRARTTRISIEANSSICRGMLRHRYDSAGLGQAPEEERRAQ